MRDQWIRRLSALLWGGLIGVYTPEPMWWLVLGLFLLALVPLFLWQPRDFFGPALRTEILILCAGLLVGFVFGLTGRSNVAPPLTLSHVQVVGELKDWSVHEEGARGIMEILEPIQVPQSSLAYEQDSLTGWGSTDFPGRKYQLRVYFEADGELPEGWNLVRPGDKIEFSAKLDQPKPPGTPGQFDYPLYYAVRGLSGGITVQGEVDLIAPGKPNLSWQIRQQVRELLASYPPAQTGLLEGILFGDTSRIPEEALESYRITGVYHVFSASGSNVAFLFLLCWSFLFFLPPYLRVGITLALLIFYAVLCGGNPPILRATLMAAFILLGRLGKGRGNSQRGLFLAAFLLFCWQPLILKDIGFQLSFMATWGILILSPCLENAQVIRSWPRSIKSAFSMGCAAQIATLPLMISAFHRLSIIGILANLLVLFILGSIFELGILGVFLSYIPWIALPLFQVSLWLLQAVSELLTQLAKIPWADVWVVNPGTLFWICWYGGIFVLLMGKERIRFILKVWGGSLYRQIFPLVEKGLAYAGFEHFVGLKHYAGFKQKCVKDDWRSRGSKENSESTDRPEWAESMAGAESTETTKTTESIERAEGTENAETTEGRENKEGLGKGRKALSGFIRESLEENYDKGLGDSSGKSLGESLGKRLRKSPGKSLRNRFGVKGERVLAVLLLLLFLWSPWNTPDVLEVTFIDVGQGDCVLIETPKGTRIMVDTGPKTSSYDAGERIIVPYLLEQGIKELDALILTHPHSDHVGGAGAILETIPVGWVGIPEDGLDWLSMDNVSSDSENSQWQSWDEGGLDWDLIKRLEKMRIERLTQGDKLLLDEGITITVLAPGKILTGTKSDENNNSLILSIENQAGQRVLLTGDMEEEEMEEIYRSGQSYDADLFKVPHHGSRYSMFTPMLDQMDPLAVVIPVGKNTFGHPNRQVLDYWEERQVPIYRTDEDGTIRVKLDGVSLEVIPGRK